MDYAYKAGGNILIVKDGILRKAESPKQKKIWTITTVHSNGTIRVTGYTWNQIGRSKRPES